MSKNLRYILIAAAFFYAAFILGTSFVYKGERYFTLIDDAMISMRYGQHLAQGHGLVWNIGEKPVEGFTNLGWTLLMGFFHLFPIAASKISLTIMFTSLIVLLMNIIVVYRVAERLLPGSTYAPTLAALVTAFYFPLVFWSLRGMEVGLLTLLINYALLLSFSQDKPNLIGLALAIAIFVRLDAVISSTLIGVYFILRQRTRASALPIAITIIAAFGILFFQKIHFSDILPTSYYQKVTGYTFLERAQHGLLVFNEFAARDMLFLLLSPIAGMFFYKQFNRESFLLLVIFIAQCAYSIYVGGDYAEPETNAANRFITQGMPALIVLFSMMTSRILSDLKTAQPQSVLSNPKMNPAIPLAFAVLLIISGEPWFNYAIDNAPLLKADIRRVKLGLHIAANTSPQAVIAVHAAGQIPYYSQRATIDLLGLNDPFIAKGRGRGEFYPGHNKWNYEYSIGQLQPDLIADNFDPFGSYIHQNDQYQKLDSDIYIRIDSSQVNIEGLSKDYR